MERQIQSANPRVPRIDEEDYPPPDLTFEEPIHENPPIIAPPPPALPAYLQPHPHIEVPAAPEIHAAPELPPASELPLAPVVSEAPVAE